MECFSGEVLGEGVETICVSNQGDCSAAQEKYAAAERQLLVVPCMSVSSANQLIMVEDYGNAVSRDIHRRAAQTESRVALGASTAPSAPERRPPTVGFVCFEYRYDGKSSSECYVADDDGRARCDQRRRKGATVGLSVDQECSTQPRAACIEMKWRLKDPTLVCWAEFAHCNRERDQWSKDHKEDLLSISGCEETSR
jgi:hypothetical protein